ncbi:MAG: CerR family C-terminal domain-containing protein [Alphaproteobacteria bacterium]|nr:CerR family C-terminal domain-containing protein [Alphaproteobacteria bacterium]
MVKESQKRLLDMAKHLFALNGYQATATRDIAEAAKVNISAITYYFGGKLGLYRAVLQNIAERVQQELSEKTATVQNLLADENATAEEAENLLYKLISELCSLVCSQRLPSEDIAVFLHEYFVPGEAFDTLYQELISPVYTLAAALIVKATGNLLDHESATLYTIQLFAEMFVFRSRKQFILQQLNWNEYGEKEMTKITDVVICHTRAVLNLYKKV